MKRVACYLRVSTTEQTVENQRNDLRAYCQARGWDDVIEYNDTGSGMRERRPDLDRLMSDVKTRRIDVVVVAAFDRLGRSVRHLVETLELFRHLGVEFISLRESIDTGSPLGTAVFTIIAAIAQLERSLIVERVKSGLRRARAEGASVALAPRASGWVAHVSRSMSGSFGSSRARTFPSALPRKRSACRRPRICAWFASPTAARR